MTGAILEIEELCGALSAAQMDTLRMWPDRKVDLALELCRMAAAQERRAHHGDDAPAAPKPRRRK